MNNGTITLYNYHKNADKSESWRRTVIHGCSYYYSNTRTTDSAGKVHFIPTLNITIPQNAPQSQYVDAKTYSKLSNTEGYFTFDSANTKDVVVCGEITQELSSTYTITNLFTDYQKSAKISALFDNTDAPRLKHWKVVCM